MINQLNLQLEKVIFIFILLFIGFSLFSIAGSQISLGIILLLWFVRMGFERRWLLNKTPLDIAFGLFVLVCLVATVFSIRPHESLINFKNVILISVVYVISQNLKTSKQITLAIDVLVFVAAIVGLV